MIVTFQFFVTRSGAIEDFALLGCNSVVVYVVSQSVEIAFRLHLNRPWIFKEEGDTFLRNFDKPLLIYTASHPKGRKSQGNLILWVCTERYITSGRIPEMRVIQFTAVSHAIFCFQQTAGRPFNCTLDVVEWRCPTSGTGVETRRVQPFLDLSVSSLVSDCCVLYCYAEVRFKQRS
jgi:hypothetical protein